MIAEAVDAAQQADYVIAVVGDNVSLIGEGRSTATLELLGGQVALLEALAETGTPLIVVLLNSKPAVLPEAALNAAALIQAFNPGMRGGRAIAELILGRIEPSGRLPVSFARHVGQQPVYYNILRGQHGDRYADLTQDPLFAFGEGLSYSTVEYADLVVHTPEVTPDDTIRAAGDADQHRHPPGAGNRSGLRSDLVTTVTWAEKELKSYRQVTCRPGRNRDRRPRDFPPPPAPWSPPTSRRIVEPGEFALLVGPSSRPADLLSASFRISPDKSSPTDEPERGSSNVPPGLAHNLIN